MQQIIEGNSIPIGGLSWTKDMPSEIDCLLVVGQNLRNNDVAPALHPEVGQFLFHSFRVVRKLQTKHGAALVGFNSFNIDLFQARGSQHSSGEIEYLVQSLLAV